jgi:hypothetical protein
MTRDGRRTAFACMYGCPKWQTLTLSPIRHNTPPTHRARSVLAGVRPSALLLTGDLVDAKTANLEGSRQHPEEWEVRRLRWRWPRGGWCGGVMS